MVKNFITANQRYVVMGKNVPRSVGFRYNRSAIEYSDYFREKGGKPKIYIRTIEEIKKRFMRS